MFHGNVEFAVSLPAPVHPLFGFLTHHLDLSKAADDILIFPVIGMYQSKLSLSNSSLLVSHVFLLQKELMAWLQEELPKAVS